MCTYLIEGALRIPSWCLISWIKYMPKLLNTNIHYTLEEKKWHQCQSGMEMYILYHIVGFSHGVKSSQI